MEMPRRAAASVDANCSLGTRSRIGRLVSGARRAPR